MSLQLKRSVELSTHDRIDKLKKYRRVLTSPIKARSYRPHNAIKWAVLWYPKTTFEWSLDATIDKIAFAMKIYEFTSSLSRKSALRSLLSLIACSSWLANEWRSAEDFSLSRSISLRMSTTSLSYLPWERRKRRNYFKRFVTKLLWLTLLLWKKVPVLF